jgi:hypothetical protein
MVIDKILGAVAFLVLAGCISLALWGACILVFSLDVPPVLVRV